MPIAKIIATDTDTTLYFDTILLRYTDNGIVDFDFFSERQDNYPEVYIPEAFYEMMLSSNVSLKKLFQQYKNSLLEMSKNYRKSKL